MDEKRLTGNYQLLPLLHSGLDSNMGNRIYTKSNFGFNFGPSGYMGLKKCTHYKYWLNNYPIQKKLTSSLYEAV